MSDNKEEATILVNTLFPDIGRKDRLTVIVESSLFFLAVV